MESKIIFSCQFSTAFGGVQHAMLDIVQHIDKTRFKPMVVCAPEGELPLMAERAGAEVKTVGIGKFWRYSIRQPAGSVKDMILAAREFVRLARQENIRLIHTFDGAVFFAASLARLFVRDLKIIWLDSGFNVYPLHFRLVMRWCFKRAALVAAITSIRQSQQFDEGLDPAKSAVTPLGTDFHLRHRDNVCAEKELRPCGFRIGIVGRIVPIKNFELFLRAARIVACSHPQTEFVIVGGKGLFEDEIAYFKSIVELTKALNLEDRVIFLEPTENLLPLLDSFDIVVCSSHLETFGRTLVEAMALGKPVVATRVGGIPEVIADGETGFLVEPGNAEAIAGRLNQLLDDGELRLHMGQKGIERVQSHFDVKSVTRNWEKIYEQLLRN